MGIFDYNQNNGSNGHVYVIIQAQDASGNWNGRSQVPTTSPGGIRNEMEQMKRQYPESRIRAIDSQTGALYDFLP